jgi:hypothetical protein
MAQRRGLGKTFAEIQAEQAAAQARREASGRSDGLDLLIPTTPEQLQNRLAQYNTDPDFGVGYEIMGAPHNPASRRRRAEKIGYNKELKYLAILMHNDGKGSVMIGYPDVTQDEWEQLQGYNSTTEFLDSVLYRFNNNNGWERLDSLPPQTNPQLFEQGTLD